MRLDDKLALYQWSTHSASERAYRILAGQTSRMFWSTRYYMRLVWAAKTFRFGPVCD